MYPQIPPYGFNPWVPHPTGPECFYQPGWAASGSVFGQHVYGKRPRFNQEVRANDAIVVHGGRKNSASGIVNSHREVKAGSSKGRGSAQNSSSRYNAGHKNFVGGRKSVWVPIKPGGRTDNLDLRDMAGTRQPTTGQNGSSAVHGLQIGTMVIDKSEMDACAHQGKIVIGLCFDSDQKEVVGSGEAGSSLELGQQSRSEETQAAITCMVETSNKLNMQSSSARISKDVSPHCSSANSSGRNARGMPYANRRPNFQIPVQQNNFYSRGLVFKPRAVALQHKARSLGAPGSDRLCRELNQSLSGAREDSLVHRNGECSGCEH